MNKLLLAILLLNLGTLVVAKQPEVPQPIKEKDKPAAVEGAQKCSIPVPLTKLLDESNNARVEFSETDKAIVLRLKRFYFGGFFSTNSQDEVVASLDKSTSTYSAVRGYTEMGLLTNATTRCPFSDASAKEIYDALMKKKQLQDTTAKDQKDKRV